MVRVVTVHRMAQGNRRETVKDSLRSEIVACLEGIATAGNPTDAGAAICELLEASLPKLLHQYSSLLRDHLDLLHAARAGLPVAVCIRAFNVITSPEAAEVYPAYVLEYFRRSLALLVSRLDPAPGYIPCEVATPRDTTAAHRPP